MSIPLSELVEARRQAYRIQRLLEAACKRAQEAGEREDQLNLFDPESWCGSARTQAEYLVRYLDHLEVHNAAPRLDAEPPTQAGSYA